MGKHRPPVTYKGETRSLNQWAKARPSGVSLSVFLKCAQRGWTIEQLMGDAPPPPKPVTEKAAANKPRAPGLPSNPVMRSLFEVRKRLAEAQRELVAHGRVVERRVMRLRAEEERLSEAVSLLPRVAQK